MIEQTELVIDEWIYNPPSNFDGSKDQIRSDLDFEVMKKTATTKKGIACRFTCRFITGTHTILLYVAQDSYVIDLEDRIDRNEVHRMIDNSYSKFKEKYEFRKLGTLLQNTSLPEFDATTMEVSEILNMLN